MGILDIFRKRKRKNYEDDYDEEYEDEYEKKIDDLKENDYKEELNYKEEIDLKVEKNTIENLEEINLKEEVKLSKEEIDNIISSEILKVIELYDDFDQVRIVAREAANNIGREYLSELPNYLNGKIHKPSRFIDKYNEIGEWSIVVENSVLMIIYSYKEDAVPILEKVSQRNSNLNLKATNLLCKLASENVRTEEIINSIMNNLIAFSDEIKENNQVIGLIQHFYKSFVKNGEIENAYKTLKHLINAAERFTKGHLKFLKAIAMGKNVINLEEIMMIEEDDPRTLSIDKIDDSLRIDAAMTYFTLDNNDADINSKLYYLSEYSLDKNLREKIKILLSE